LRRAIIILNAAAKPQLTKSDATHFSQILTMLESVISPQLSTSTTSPSLQFSSVRKLLQIISIKEQALRYRPLALMALRVLAAAEVTSGTISHAEAQIAVSSASGSSAAVVVSPTTITEAASTVNTEQSNTAAFLSAQVLHSNSMPAAQATAQIRLLRAKHAVDENGHLGKAIVAVMGTLTAAKLPTPTKVRTILAMVQSQ